MMLKNFGQMEQFVREQSGKKRVALAAAHDADALGSLMMAVDRGIAEAILIGRRKEIVRVLDEMGKDAGDFRIIEEEDDRAAADKAVELVHCGEADMPMKRYWNFNDYYISQSYLREERVRRRILKTRFSVARPMPHWLRAYFILAR